MGKDGEPNWDQKSAETNLGHTASLPSSPGMSVASKGDVRGDCGGQEAGRSPLEGPLETPILQMGKLRLRMGNVLVRGLTLVTGNICCSLLNKQQTAVLRYNCYKLNCTSSVQFDEFPHKYTPIKPSPQSK